MRSKGAWDIEVLVLNGKTSCFVNWQDRQSTLSFGTRPNWPLETRDRKWPKDAWPNWECHKVREELVVTGVAVWTGEVLDDGMQR